MAIASVSLPRRLKGRPNRTLEWPDAMGTDFRGVSAPSGHSSFFFQGSAPMPEFDRNSFRLACVLQQGLLRRQAQDLAVSLPRWEFAHCQELHRKLERARGRGFSLAAASLAHGLERALYRLC